MTDDLQQARIEAAAKVLLRDYQSEYDGGEVSEFLDVACAALAAADAHLPSAARIAETLDAHTLGRPNGGSASVAWCDCSCGHREEMVGGIRDTVEARAKLHRARAVRALFGEVAGDDVR